MILLGNCYRAAVGQGTEKMCKETIRNKKTETVSEPPTLFQANLVLNVPAVAKDYSVERSS